MMRVIIGFLCLLDSCKGQSSEGKKVILWFSLRFYSKRATVLTCLKLRHFTLSLTKESSQTHTTELVPDVIMVVAEGHTAQRHFPQSAMHSNVVTFCTRKKLSVKCSPGDTMHLVAFALPLNEGMSLKT